MGEVFGGGVSQAQLDANLLGDHRTIFRLLAADMNSTADQIFIPAFTFTTFIIREILVTNASGAISLATGGIYTAASKGGTAIVSAAQSWAGLSSSTKTVTPTLAGTATDRRTGSLYFSLTAAMGSAATADMYIMGVAG